MVKLQLTSWTRSSVGFRTPPSYGGSARSWKSFSLIRGFLCACDLPLENEDHRGCLTTKRRGRRVGAPGRPRRKAQHSLAALGHLQFCAASAARSCPRTGLEPFTHARHIGSLAVYVSTDGEYHNL